LKTLKSNGGGKCKSMKFENYCKEQDISKEFITDDFAGNVDISICFLKWLQHGNVTLPNFGNLETKHLKIKKGRFF
jgi:hypothetical protein